MEQAPPGSASDRARLLHGLRAGPGPGSARGSPRKRTTGAEGTDCGALLYSAPFFPREQWNNDFGGDVVSTAVMTPKVHAERVVTLVNQSLQLFIVANDENYALAA